jgi:hypothetical protein
MLLVLFVLGLCIILLLLKSIKFFLPPTIVALGVLFVTSDLTLAGSAFLLVIIILIIVRR